MELATMGERGQIVIPQAIREQLELKKGTRFVLFQENGVIMMKGLQLPDKKEFAAMLRRGHERAKRLGLNEQDMWDAIARARK
ncbi:MAG: AbrB/MazE/SpoVT family DNA-binding domain-containing protein [Candidatus Woesearchaeota archaeon]|nr:AbrB/MazE/SpoVT family DNA-binding domain-containing protein [Candidatus Woesearchaeota archaeon]